MIPEINNSALGRVVRLCQTWGSTSWGREAAIAPLLQHFERKELWLLSFFSYLLSHNKIWKSLDDGLFSCIPPAPSQSAEFNDFVELLRHYQGAAVSSHNEQVLISFLSRCTAENQEFYLAVLSRQKWLREMFMATAVRERLDVGAIDPEEIYGGTTILTEGWFAVRYPLVITTVPDGELHPAIIYKDGNIVRVYKFTLLNKVNNRTRRTRLPTTWLSDDRRALTPDTMILYGMISEERKEFFPLDYFHNIEEYKRHRKTPLVSFPERQKNLDLFLRSHCLLQIKRVKRVLCRGSFAVELGVGSALQNSPYTSVLLCDEKGRTYTVPTDVHEGVLDGLWQEDGEVRGMEVWSNTRKLHCSLDFSEEHHNLLYNSKLWQGKHALFHHFHFKGFNTGVIKEILWDKQPYFKGRVSFLNGDYGFLERCPVCLRDDVKHNRYCGVCSITYINWRSMLASRGTNRWFEPSRKIRIRRKQLGWEPHMINNVWISTRGYRVVADDQGRIMFKSDPEAEMYYEQAKRSTRMPFNELRISETPEELREWYLKNYKIKGKETDNDGSGTVREVSGLHDNGTMENAGAG